MAITAQNVRRVTNDIVESLLKMPDDSARRAALANWRRGVGKAPGELPRVMGLLLQRIPEEMYADDRGYEREEASPAEWAIYTAVTLFALHQQEKDCRLEPMHREGKTFGAAMAGLAGKEEDKERIIRRFNMVITSADMREMSHHLRSVAQMLNAKGIPADYAALAGDVYRYQRISDRDSVRLQWGQNFYGTLNRKKQRC
ncbi:MAG: type I-E CRISPR-associated protein Cse2/CasB [Clostridiales bacterium]|nr:type I-E CRISPR-associated protein Cse2/CasB [Clostridiales bacterium]